MYTDVIIICVVSTLSISMFCSEKSSLFIMVDLSRAYMALPCFGSPWCMIRCIPGMFGGAMALCVSCRHRMSGRRTERMSHLVAEIPSTLKLIILKVSMVWERWVEGLSFYHPSSSDIRRVV